MPIKDLSEYTSQSIESILNQSYQNFELIIIIDGDKNIIINFLNINYYNEIKSSKIIILINEFNLGVTKSLNIGIKNSKGKYIARNDSDDISHNDRIIKQLAFIESNPNYKIVACEFRIINKNQKVLKHKKIKNLEKNKLFNYLNPIAHSSVMFTKKFIEELNYYDENMYTSQDFELWSKAFILKPKCIGIMHKVYVDIRVHKKSISYNNELIQKKNSVLICMRNRYPSKNSFFINQKLDYLYLHKNTLLSPDMLIDFEALTFCYIGYNNFSIKGLSRLLLLIKIIKIYLFHKGLALNSIKTVFIK